MEAVASKKTKQMIIGLVILVFVLLIYSCNQNQRAAEAEANPAAEAAVVLEKKFSEAITLHVATISGKIVARADDEGFAGLIPTSQTRRLPFSVDYFVDLKGLSVGSYRWHEPTNTMTVEIPDVRPSKPNIDEASEVAETAKGVFVSRGASVRLQRQLSGRANTAAKNEAMQPENLEKARLHARRAIANIVRAPLAAAGLANINVQTKFPWERSSQTAERWDESTPLSEILKRYGETK